jgi:hypothetical protein
MAIDLNNLPGDVTPADQHVIVREIGGDSSAYLGKSRHLCRSEARQYPPLPVFDFGA